MKKQIETTKQLDKVVSEMVKDIDEKLSIHKKYKTFKTKVSDRQYNINVISEDGFEMITSAAIETIIEIKNAYNVFYRLLLFYHAGVCEYKGKKCPTIEISVGGLF